LRRLGDWAFPTPNHATSATVADDENEPLPKRNGSDDDNRDDDDDREMAEIDGRLHGLVEEFDNGGETAEEKRGPDSSRDKGLSLRNEITSTTPPCRRITRSMTMARQKEISLRSDSTGDDEVQQNRLEENNDMVHNKSPLITDNRSREALTDDDTFDNFTTTTTVDTTELTTPTTAPELIAPTTDSSTDDPLTTPPPNDANSPDFTNSNNPHTPYTPANDEHGLPPPPPPPPPSPHKQW
jgi:hypothetical protein